jgi:hypothetical protein
VVVWLPAQVRVIVTRSLSSITVRAMSVRTARMISLRSLSVVVGAFHSNAPDNAHNSIN